MLSFFILLLLTFALITCILISVQATMWTIISVLVGVAVAIFSILFGTYKIVNHAFEKRDKQIDQLLASEQQFKDFREETGKCFITFTSDLKEVSNKLDAQTEKLNNKLDAQGRAIAKMEGKLEELSKK